MEDALKNKWLELTLKYTTNESLLNALWTELKIKYSEKSRFYHNLSHINNLLEHAQHLKADIVDYDILLFAIWYHDIIYKSTKKDNEDKSAVIAKKRLNSLKIKEKSIALVQNLIISTKKHEILLTKNNDNAYFLDMDLSILGTDWNIYHNYLKNIRKEYAIFPNFMYRKGRIKVLQHFLQRDNLYFTKYFQKKHENQARENLKKEIELLKK